MMQATQRYRVAYQTDRYRCPSDSTNRDYNSNFLGCGHVVPTDKPPCVSFDNENLVCLGCMHNFVLTDLGVC